MLVLAKVRRGREHYYLASLPREQTDAGLVEELGVWHGAAAAELGLAGRHVEPEQLAQLLSGRAPDGSELDPGHARVDVVAYDCTFTCPKGVSLLERLGPEALAVETRKAHEGAVAATLGYLERHAAVVRRSREGGRVSEGASGLIAAAFLHQASRAPDPHLHTHLLVANLARDDAGRWSALDARPLFLERAAAGALYAAELRSRLGAALGVSWRKEREALDLAGVPRPVSVAFSRRQAAIADELARFGSQSPAAARVASLRTRPPKDRSVSIERLGDVWRERALDLGVAPSRWSRVAPGRPELASGHRLAPAVQAALTSLEVPFSRRSLVAAVARSSTEGAAVEEVETAAAAALEDRTVVVAVSKGAVSMGKGAVKVPGVVEERFATVASLVSHERLRTILASSLALPGDFSFPVAGVVLRQDDETARDELAERSLRARVAGRPVRVLSVGPRLEAPSKEDASALFASLPTVSRAGARTTPGSILVVPDADRLRLADLVELLEPAEGGRATVVLMFGRNDASRDHGRFPARAALFEASRRVHSRERAEKTPSRSAAVALSESALLVDLRSRLSRAAKSDLGRDLGIGR